MASAVLFDRLTGEVLKFYKRGVPADADQKDMLVNPDLSGVAFEPVKYWKVVGKSVVLKKRAEQQATDQRLLDGRRDSLCDQLDDLEGITRAVAMVFLDEINELRTLNALPLRTGADFKAAVRKKVGQ